MVLETYKFGNIKNYRQFNKVSGIYALIYNNEVIYVGQSINIKSRLSSHHCIDTRIKAYSSKRQTKGRDNMLSFYNFLRDHMNDILFLVLPAPIDELNELEEHYISKYAPKYNYAGVKSKFYPVNRKVS